MYDDPWQRVAVCVVTLNEERTLPRCLESVTPCGELIVVDSGSTDGTREVAHSLGAKWFERPWDGFAGQRSFAELEAEREWVFFLDADEAVSPELRQELAGRITSGEADSSLYAIRRQSEFLGRQVVFGDWRNDWVTRFAPRGRTRWLGLEPHPALVGDDLVERRCRGVLHHRPCHDVGELRRKIESYAATWAAQSRLMGRTGSIWEGWVRAAWRFVRGYLLRGGFLDGRAGWHIAAQNARMAYLKYFFLSRHDHRSQS